MSSCDRCEFPPNFNGHWRSPFAALRASANCDPNKIAGGLLTVFYIPHILFFRIWFIFNQNIYSKGPIDNDARTPAYIHASVSLHLPDTLARCLFICTVYPIHWRHNGRDGVSNHQSIQAQIIKKSKLRVEAFVRGIHRSLVNSPHKGRVTRKIFPFDDVIMPMKYMPIVLLRLPCCGSVSMVWSICENDELILSRLPSLVLGHLYHWSNTEGCG